MKIKILACYLDLIPASLKLFLTIGMIFYASKNVFAEVLEEFVDWTDLVNVSVNGETIERPTYGWTLHSGAASTQTISGDGGVKVQAIQTNKTRAIGLSASNLGSTFRDIDYSIHLTSVDSKVLEKGATKFNLGAYVSTDIFSVERSGSEIQYKKNDVLLYTSTIPSSGDLLVDVSLPTGKGRFEEVKIFTPLPPPTFAEDVSIGSVSSPANLDVYGTSTLGPVTLDVTGGDIGSADNPDYSSAPFWLNHDGGNLGLDSDQLSSGADPYFTIQNTNANGGIRFHTGGSTVDCLIIEADGTVKLPNSAGDISMGNFTAQ